MELPEPGRMELSSFDIVELAQIVRVTQVVRVPEEVESL